MAAGFVWRRTEALIKRGYRYLRRQGAHEPVVADVAVNNDTDTSIGRSKKRDSVDIFKLVGAGSHAGANLSPQSGSDVSPKENANNLDDKTEGKEDGEKYMYPTPVTQAAKPSFARRDLSVARNAKEFADKNLSNSIPFTNSGIVDENTPGDGHSISNGALVDEPSRPKPSDSATMSAEDDEEWFDVKEFNSSLGNNLHPAARELQLSKKKLWPRTRRLRTQNQSPGRRGQGQRCGGQCPGGGDWASTLQ